MHGQLDCSSVPGQGTTYILRVELQIADDASIRLLNAHSHSSSDGSSVELSGLHLLIAEDNDLNWEIIQAQLSEYGLQCDRAENGQECIDMLTAAPAHTYQLILMDIQMPILNGKEAAKQIRASQNPDINQIPIIAMTADAFAEDIRDCLDAGMNGHIAKPIDMKKVLQTISTVCCSSETP